jgi:putative peptidoglycan lipid II flippase
MVTIVLCVFSVPLTRLVFQRGNFTAADTQLVSNVQTCFALQIPFYLGGTLLVRYFASANATRVMMWGAVLSFGANVSFNYLLMRPLGVVGISLSTSIVYFLSFAFLLFMLKRIRMEAA